VRAVKTFVKFNLLIARDRNMLYDDARFRHRTRTPIVALDNDEIQDDDRLTLELQEKEAILALTTLYRRLEAGEIDDREFVAEESRLSSQLESLRSLLFS
jgi:hypothetical protein